MLRSVHFLLSLLIPVFVVLMMGCIRAKEEKADLGPEVPADEIDRALSKAMHGADLSQTRVGQFLSYSVVRRLENEETTINLGSTRVDVFDKTETANEVRFTLKIVKAQRMNDGSFEVRQSEEPLVLQKSPNIASRLSAASLSANQVSATEKKPSKTTFHRLRTSDGTREVPAAVKGKVDCGGLSPCELPVHYIQFDMVQWYTDDSYQKVALDFAFSTKTPYLPFGENFDQLNGVLITDCRATLIPAEGRTVYVRDCMDLEDFQK